jgi:prevent-host-death family protein
VTALIRRFAAWCRHATPDGDATPRHHIQPVEYNTRDARDLFSHLLRRVRQGEQIVIAHAGHPIAKLVPYSTDEPRRPGVIRAQIVVQDDVRERDA